MSIERRNIPCPFCNNLIEAEITSSEKRQKIIRHRGRTSTKMWWTQEKSEVFSSCSKCGKSKAEINKVLKGNKSTLDVDARRKRLEELKKLGFSGVIGEKSK